MQEYFIKSVNSLKCVKLVELPFNWVGGGINLCTNDNLNRQRCFVFWLWGVAVITDTNCDQSKLTNNRIHSANFDSNATIRAHFLTVTKSHWESRQRRQFEGDRLPIFFPFKALLTCVFSRSISFSPTTFFPACHVSHTSGIGTIADTRPHPHGHELDTIIAATLLLHFSSQVAENGERFSCFISQWRFMRKLESSGQWLTAPSGQPRFWLSIFVCGQIKACSQDNRQGAGSQWQIETMADSQGNEHRHCTQQHHTEPQRVWERSQKRPEREPR